MSKALATKNVAAALIGLGLIVAFAFTFATPAKADTLSDLQAQVQALLAQIAALQGGSSTSSTTGGACFTFTQNLTMKSSGTEVMNLQKFLNTHGAVIASTGAGSPGNETMYFGGLTKAAVIKWQNANASTVLAPVGLSAGTGYWGASSRAAANQMCAGGSTGTGNTGTGTTNGTGITVTAGTQPANSLAPENASRVPFTTFTLTNNSGAAVTINGITVERTGLAQDAAFSGVVLVDSNGNQVGVARTFNSNHQATVGDTMTLNAGQSMTYTVAGNMAADESAYAGEVASISVVGVNTTVPVAGSLPISGAAQTINFSLTIGQVSAQTSSLDPNSAQQKNIGDTGVTFSAIRLQAGSAEDVKLYGVRFRMNGSASASDLSNLAIVVNGTSYPATWSADGRYVSASISGGVLITKGASVDVSVKGDISGGNASGRVAEFDIDKATDVYLVGQLYGYGIVPTVGSTNALYTTSTHQSTFSTSQPWFQGSTISIQGGTGTTIQNATSVSAQNIAVNVPNQVLGGFSTNFAGEPVTVQKMVFHVSTSSGADMLTNVSIVDQNGSVVAGPVDQVGTTLTFSDSVTFPVGSATYTLKGQVGSNAANSSTYKLSTNPSSDWTNVTGEQSGNSVSLSGFGNFTMNTMTVQGLTLSVSMSSTPASQNIVAGGQQILMANVQLDASASGEDVRVNSIPLELTTSGAANKSDLTACQLYDSNGNALNYGSNIINSPATSTNITYTFNNALTVAKGTVATLALKCNVSSGAAATAAYEWQDYTGSTMTISGMNSGSSQNITESVSNSGTMTVASGGLTMSKDASSPSQTLVAGGTTGVTVGVIKFRPSAQAMTLTKIGVHIGSGSRADVSRVYFYNSSGALLGSAVFAGLDYATSTLQTTLSLPADTDTLVTVKADLSDIGTGQAGTDGALVKINPSSAEATGAADGNTHKAGTTDTVAGALTYNTFPTIAQDTVNSTGVADGKLLRFKVTADSHGNVGINQFAFTVATSSLTVTQMKLYGFSDSSYSNPISSGAASDGQIGNVVASAHTFKISPTTGSAVEVPAGSTYYFELRGIATGISSNSSVVTTLLGDSSIPGTNPDTFANLTAGNNLVWSPNATTTAVAASNDWTNGASVSGLPSAGFSQGRSQ